MRRRRTLDSTVVLVLVCLLLTPPLAIGPLSPVAAALAQDAAEPEPGTPTDLAIVALHCAEAPAAEALTSYFATGAPPDACAPAVGVAIGVMENEAALPGSPFQTDVAGSLVVPVGLGSQIEVAEDAASLPDGYEPLVGEANGVPYANPVQLDSAVAAAAVLFVNVPSSVAALAQQAGEVAAGEDAASPAVDAASESNGCDLATPAEGDAAILAPVARTPGSNIDTANTGSDPISTAGSSAEVAASGAYQNSAIAGGDAFVFVSDPVRTGAGVWGWQGSQRSGDRLWRFNGSHAGDWRVHGNGLWLWPGDASRDGARNLVFSGSSVRSGDGIWFLNLDRGSGDYWLWPGRFGADHLAAASSGDGNLALVSNSVHIGDGVWRWPGHGHADDWRGHEKDSWTWGDDRDRDQDWRMDDRGVWVRSGGFASSGNGSLAISAHSVRIGPGVWFWPFDRNRADDRRWRTRDRFDDWFVHGHGVWLWPGRIGIDNLAAARSGNGSLAIVASAVRIGHGVWQLPAGRVGHSGGDWLGPRHTGSGIWVLSTAVARSSSGTLAVSSHAVRIDSGLWLLPSHHDRGHNWLDQVGHARADAAAIASQADDASAAVESPSGKLEQDTGPDQPAPAIGEEATVAAPPADSVELPSGDVEQPASDEPAAAPLDNAAPSSDVDPAAVDPAAVAPAAAPEPVADAPDAGTVAPDPGYSDPGAAEPAIAPSTVEPAAAPSAEAVNVESAPNYVEPALEDPSDGSSGYVESGVVEPEVDPGYVEPAVAPAVDPGFADPGVDSPGSFVPDPGPDPGFAAPGAGAPSLDFADPGANSGGVAPEPVMAAPSGGGTGVDVPGSAAPDIGPGGPGNGGADSFAPVNVEPAAGADLTGGDGEDD